MSAIRGCRDDGGMNSPRLRLGRSSIVGQSYTLTMVCLHRRPWFADPHNAAIMMELFPQLDEQGLCCSQAWVVMPDHIHWLVELRAHTLAHIAQRLKSRSALLLNRLHGRTGPMWQSGYHDHAVRSDESLHRHAMYILGNPVRAGLAEQIGQYPYAGCRWPITDG